MTAIRYSLLLLLAGACGCQLPIGPANEDTPQRYYHIPEITGMHSIDSGSISIIWHAGGVEQTYSLGSSFVYSDSTFLEIAGDGPNQRLMRLAGHFAESRVDSLRQSTTYSLRIKSYFSKDTVLYSSRITITYGQSLSLLASLEVLPSSIWDADWTSDGNSMISLGSGFFNIWNANTYAKEQTIAFCTSGQAMLSLDPSNSKAAIAGNYLRPSLSDPPQHEVRIYDLLNQRCTNLFRHAQLVRAAYFVPDGNSLLVLGYKPAYTLWKLSDSSVIYESYLDSIAVGSSAVSNDRKHVVLGSIGDNHVRLLSTLDGSIEHVYDGSNGANGTTISEDGRLVAATDGFKISVWKVTGELLSTITPSTSPWLGPIAISSDNRLLYVTDGAGRVSVWQLPDGSLLHVLYSYAGTPSRITFSPDKTKLLCVTGGAMTIWETRLTPNWSWSGYEY